MGRSARMQLLAGKYQAMDRLGWSLNSILVCPRQGLTSALGLSARAPLLCRYRCNTLWRLCCSLVRARHWQSCRARVAHSALASASSLAAGAANLSPDLRACLQGSAGLVHIE